MILVTVGTRTEKFTRLLNEIDRLVKSKKIRDDVIVQAGYNDFESKHMKVFDFVSLEKMTELMKRSRVIVTSDGIGTVLLTLRLNKPTVVVPRFKKYNETVNETPGLVKVLDKQKKIITVYDICKLEGAIKEAYNFKVKKQNENKKIFKILKNYLGELNARK